MWTVWRVAQGFRPQKLPSSGGQFGFQEVFLRRFVVRQGLRVTQASVAVFLDAWVACNLGRRSGPALHVCGVLAYLPACLLAFARVPGCGWRSAMT